MPTETLPLVFDQSFDQLSKMFISWGEPEFRARQLWQGLYRQLWSTSEKFTNLPVGLRKKLGETFRFSALELIQQAASIDGHTSKLLFNVAGGHPIETILMQYQDRVSLCISSQAGCALGCSFCATGQLGFRRNLTRGEIAEQVLFLARQLKLQGQHITNVVVMGMGEPFLNYDHVLSALELLNDPEGLGMGERRFTVSTAGIIPGIRRFTQANSQINLAVSLHAANDALRSTMMPVNKKYPLQELIQACRDYTQQTKRRITFEWAMIHNVNDRQVDAAELVQLLRGILCHVNLIPLNPTGFSPQQPSPPEQVNRFKLWLEKAGIPVTVRLRRGIDIYAGCGQLAGRNLPPGMI